MQLPMADQRKDFLSEVISLSESQIKLSNTKLHKHNTAIQDTMRSMANNLENMLFGLGLDEDQKKVDDTCR
ncbi:MAG: hypothetical protein KUG72_13475 [Pseudomonadales bacterium]|nr:hypothetical protein [Pseudomonadales bacterium]